MSVPVVAVVVTFLSIQAQDFIEDLIERADTYGTAIPEHSSSGLH